MIDVIEDRYEIVHVQRQKYICACRGCVETALGPNMERTSERSEQGGARDSGLTLLARLGP